MASILTDIFADPTRRTMLAAAGAGLALAAWPGGRAQAQTADDGIALVTGCSSGFGYLTALALARTGITTAATMRDPEGANAEAAQRLVAVADSEGLPLTVIGLDVSDPDSVARAVEMARADGDISLLVNNAGYILAGSIELHSDEDVRQQFETNLYGYHRLVRQVAPAMRGRGRGLIVQVSSGLGRIIFPTQGWYVATKFAIEGMSEALAYELSPFGVEVSIVQPTQYPTQFLANGRRYFEALTDRLDDERSTAYAEQIGMTRFGLQDPEDDGALPPASDVADAIVDLAQMPDGTRPLRRIVSPEPQGLERINAGLAAAQDAVFGGTPFAAWRAAVTD